LVDEQTIEIEEEIVEHGDAKVYVASQWQLIWWRFRRHRLALVSAILLIFIYLVVLFAEFVAPYDPGDYIARYTYAPPQTLHLFDSSSGQLTFSPYVNDYKVEIDQEALRRTFVIDPETQIPVRFFVKGWPYKLFGLIETDIHLIGPDGQMAAQGDGPPLQGVASSSLWRAGDTLLDRHDLGLPADLPPGAYRLAVGLYDLATLQRLPVTVDGRPAGDTVELGKLVTR
jgi:hypothetical protein